jgi:hypothetical protein
MATSGAAAAANGSAKYVAGYGPASTHGSVAVPAVTASATTEAVASCATETGSMEAAKRLTTSSSESRSASTRTGSAKTTHDFA